MRNVRHIRQNVRQDLGGRQTSANARQRTSAAYIYDGRGGRMTRDVVARSLATTSANRTPANIRDATYARTPACAPTGRADERTNVAGRRAGC